MHKIKVAAPAKINLTLEVLNKRSDGFHNIKSIMQAISLYDYISINVTNNENSKSNEIILSGNSTEIPYDKSNLVHKACEKFLTETQIANKKIEIYIEKNIPVAAGLAGGSTDAAATFFALDAIFETQLNKTELDTLCSSLGSDLNFCLYGGTAICTARGEKTEKIKTIKQPVTLIKPIGLGISAKEAYTKFSKLKDKSIPNNTEKLIEKFDKAFLYNSLEKAVINDYDELIEIKKEIPNSIMSGSGPTFFVLEDSIKTNLDNDKYLIIENLNFIDKGVHIVK